MMAAALMQLRMNQRAEDAALASAERAADEASAAVVRGDRGPEMPAGVVDARGDPASICMAAHHDAADARMRAVEADIAYERAVRAIGGHVG